MDKRLFAVVHRGATGTVIRRFNNRALANYFITDCFGPESSDYRVINIMKSSKGIGLTI
jgi:hypothetical protein